jgi:tRNA(Ile)-lysidine synthase
VSKPVPLSDFHARIHTGIRQRGLLRRGEPLLLAVSGGQDSLCLLQVLVDLAPRWDWRLSVLHCNHRWSEDESRCAAFLADWIPQTYGILCQVATAEQIQTQEAAARAWRYQQLRHWAKVWGCTAVVTGHTGTDKAESLLLHLLRGSGAQGLSTLHWQRPLHGGDPELRLVRPLLEVWRQETAAFCQEHQLPVWADQSNSNLRYARNRLRHQVMPLLREHFNPQVERALCQTADLLAADHSWILAQVDQLWPQIYQPDPPRLDRRILKQQPLALQRACLCRLLSQHLPHQLKFEQVEAVQQLVAGPNRSKTSSLGSGFYAENHGNELILSREGS